MLSTTYLLYNFLQIDMLETLDNPTSKIEDLLGIGNDFPDNIYVASTPTGEFVCFKANSLFGLACFTNEKSTLNFLNEYWKNLPANPEEVSFDEARDIAKSRKNKNINCLLMLDNPNEPKVHHIK